MVLVLAATGALSCANQKVSVDRRREKLRKAHFFHVARSGRLDAPRRRRVNHSRAAVVFLRQLGELAVGVAVLDVPAPDLRQEALADRCALRGLDALEQTPALQLVARLELTLAPRPQLGQLPSPRH